MASKEKGSDTFLSISVLVEKWRKLLHVLHCALITKRCTTLGDFCLVAMPVEISKEISSELMKSHNALQGKEYSQCSL